MNQKEIDKLKEVRQLAEELIARYCPTFKFDFDNSKRRLGLCSFRKQKITVSTFYSLNLEEKFIKDVILHEIAHAMLPSYIGHDWRWKKQAREIGCTATRTFAPSIRPPSKYKTTCPNCGKEGFSYRKFTSACRNCCERYSGGRYDEKYKLIWEKLS